VFFSLPPYYYIFIYINNQFIHFLSALNVHLWYQFDVQKEKKARKGKEKPAEHLRILLKREVFEEQNAKVCKQAK
jgi:hypothetical protein